MARLSTASTCDNRLSTLSITFCVLSREAPGGRLTEQTINPWSSVGINDEGVVFHHPECSKAYDHQCNYSDPFVADKKLYALFIFIGSSTEAGIKSIKESCPKSLFDNMPFFFFIM